jgi:hypothetical protein
MQQRIDPVAVKKANYENSIKAIDAARIAMPVVGAIAGGIYSWKMKSGAKRGAINALMGAALIGIPVFALTYMKRKEYQEELEKLG